MRNVKRYERQVSELRKLGWRVITIWECQLDQSALRRRVRTLLGGKIK
jgi:G:T-mismatch repair DNA endonuclease (very short patch repair protein)